MQDKKIDFIINGELYLKRGPEPYNPSKKELDELDDKISEMEFDTSKENPDFSKLPILEGYQNLKRMMESAIGEQDYSGTADFWQLSTTDGKLIKLNQCTICLQLSRVYSTIEKLDRDFVKLSEFLKKATFVGREFNRTSPIISTSGKSDISYMKTDFDIHETKYIVLYATRDLFLIKRIDYLGEKYALINSRYTLDGNYEFFGPVY